MAKRDPTEYVIEPARGGGVLPWSLLFVLLGLAGYGYWTMHRPLAEDARKKDAALVEMTKLLSDAKGEAAAAKAAQADLERAQGELKQAREDLARTAASSAADQKLLEQLKKEVGAAEVNRGEGQITVTMVDRILFKSGQADLSPEGQQVLTKLAGVLRGIDKLVEVGGHADNQPVESQVKERYPTNWELSTARATNVVRFLEGAGVKPRRLKAAGFSSTRPVASNATAGGRAKNRRIEILLLPDKIKVVKGDAEELAAAEPAKPEPAKPAASKPEPAKPAASKPAAHRARKKK